MLTHDKKIENSMPERTRTDRRNALRAILGKYGNLNRDHLISVFQEVQELEGYISKETLAEVAEAMNLPPSEIYGITTFYKQFRFYPPPRYTFYFCQGTACHVRKNPLLQDALSQELKIREGETTRDGLFGIELLPCLDACGFAPVIRVNDTLYPSMTREKLMNLLEKLRREAAETASADEIGTSASAPQEQHADGDERR